MIKELFGKGRVRVEGVLDDGRTFTGKATFVGEFDEKSALRHAVETVAVEHGAKVSRIRVSAVAGYSTGDGVVTGQWFDVKEMR